MTLKEFRRAFKQDDRFLVNVMSHKTFYAHGPAQIVLTGTLHIWISVFVQEACSKVPGVRNEEDEALFPSFNGTKMESSQTKQSSQCGKKQGLEDVFTAHF